MASLHRSLKGIYCRHINLSRELIRRILPRYRHGTGTSVTRGQRSLMTAQNRAPSNKSERHAPLTRCDAQGLVRHPSTTDMIRERRKCNLTQQKSVILKATDASDPSPLHLRWKIFVAPGKLACKVTETHCLELSGSRVGPQTLRRSSQWGLWLGFTRMRLSSLRTRCFKRVRLEQLTHKGFRSDASNYSAVLVEAQRELWRM